MIISRVKSPRPSSTTNLEEASQVEMVNKNPVVRLSVIGRTRWKVEGESGDGNGNVDNDHYEGGKGSDKSLTFNNWIFSWQNVG